MRIAWLAAGPLLIVCHGSAGAAAPNSQDPAPAPVVDQAPSAPPASAPAPARPVTATLSFTGPYGPVLYVAHEGAGISVIDQSDLRALRDIGIFARRLAVVGLERRGQFLYVRVVGGAIVLYDIHDPLHPVQILVSGRSAPGSPGVLTPPAPRSGAALLITGIVLAPVSAASLIGGGVVIKRAMESTAGSLDEGLGKFTGSILLAIGIGTAAAGIGLIAAGAVRAKHAHSRPRTDRLHLSPYAAADGGGLFAAGRF